MFKCSRRFWRIVIAFKRRQLYMIGAHCRKCVEKKVANVVLRKKDAYCSDCFVLSVNHKFRACLGKSRAVKPGDKVLIAFSGNFNSTALLHLVNSGIKDSSHKKLMICPSILYIDESTALNVPAEDHTKTNERILEVLGSYDYAKYIVPLELALESQEAVDSFLANKTHMSDSSNLRDLFDSVTDITSRTDLLNKLRYRLLAGVAESLGCEKVFTAESADDLAVKLFTNISLGRGAQLPYDVGFSDDRFEGLKLVRPMRDISKKEIAYYNTFQDLPSVHVASFSTKLDPHSSIQKLTETFLCELQDGFPSTLSTVFRVADKLTTLATDTDVCALCKAPVDTELAASSSLNATNFSSLLSSLGSSNFDSFTLTESNSSGECCSGGGDSCGTKAPCCNKPTENLFSDSLCYGCRLIVRNVKLPPQIAKQLRESSIRTKMKKEIEDFLL